MRSGSLVLVLIFAVIVGGGCKKERAAPPAAPVAEKAYAADVARICDVMKLSGAAEAPEGQQMFTVADWLGRNLETDAGHDFLVVFQQTADTGKAALLSAEASRLNLGSCALASSWGGP